MTPENIPPAYIAQVAQVESGNNPLARARTSSAGGLFQFIIPTWEGLRREHPELKLTKEGRFDPAQAERAFRVFTSKNAEAFRRAMGREPTMSEMYLAHFLGSGTAVAACTAALGTPVAAVLGAGAIKANPFLRGMTCADMRNWARKKVPDGIADKRVSTPSAPGMPIGRGPARRLTTAELNDEELRRVASAPPKT